MTPALQRALRTLLQAAVAAVGAVSLNAIFSGLDPQVIGSLQVMLTAGVSHLQNMLEDSGTVPAILKPAPVPAPVEPVKKKPRTRK